MTSSDLSELLVIIIPTAVALLALAVAWGAALMRQKTMGKDITALEEKADDADSKFLTIKGHTLMCENTALRFEQKVTKEIKTMGDTLVLKIEAIINGGGK